MKFIYSLMLFTFLMSTFTPVSGWGGSNPETEKCIKKYGNKITQDQIKQCIANSGVLVRNNNTGVIAYSPDNKSFQSCKSSMGADKINSTAFSKCVAALEAKNKAPVAEPKPTSVQTASSCDSKEGQALVAGGKCGCQTGYTAEVGKTPLSCIKNVVAPPVGGQCDGKTTTKGCICTSPETPILVSGGAQNSSSNIYGCKSSAVPIPDAGSDCLANARRFIAQCESDATTAVNKCDPEAAERDTDSPDVGQILKQIGTAAVAKGAGSGAYDACLKTALASQSGYYAIDEYKSMNCDPQVNQCKSSCDSAKSYLSENSDEIVNQCMNEFNRLNASVNVTEEQTTTYRNSVVDALTDMATEAKESQNNCEVNAVSMQDKLKQTTSDFSNAAKQAQICRCQTGSTGEDCNAIQGPAQCVLNPHAAGCALSTINCNNSDSLQCRCTRNPNLAECTSKNGGPSVFASPGFKPTTTPNGVSPKISTDDFDINFDEESNVASVSGTEGLPTSPFGSAEAGGSGGGGGAASKAGEGDPAAVAADGEGGLKHLLDKPKSIIGGLLNKLGFGTGTPSDKKYKTDANGRKIDPNKWRPGMLRGVAGDGSEIGPKHRDIWKQMNSQYFLQEKTFIQEK